MQKSQFTILSNVDKKKPQKCFKVCSDTMIYACDLISTISTAISLHIPFETKEMIMFGRRSYQSGCEQRTCLNRMRVDRWVSTRGRQSNNIRSATTVYECCTRQRQALQIILFYSRSNYSLVCMETTSFIPQFELAPNQNRKWYSCLASIRNESVINGRVATQIDCTCAYRLSSSSTLPTETEQDF